MHAWIIWILWIMGSAPAAAQAISESPTLYGSSWVPSSTQDVTVYGPMELARRGGKLVEDILVSDESIHMVRTAGPAGRTATFVQGIDSDHILFMIDGVEVNDPISPGRSFEFSQMPTADIERIEVIKGGDGIRHGSGANAAVINIVTKHGTQKKPLQFGAEAGSFGTVRGHIDGSLGSVDHSVNIGIGGAKSQGISAASVDRGNSEKDGFAAKNATLRLRSRIANRDWIDISSRYQILNYDLDESGGGIVVDDPNDVMKTTETTVRGAYEHGASREPWNLKAFVGGYRINRSQNNPVDAAQPDIASSGIFVGQSATTGIDQSLRLDDGTKVLGGISFKQDEGNAVTRYGSTETNFGQRNAHASGVWAQYMSPELKLLFVDVGSRVEEHNRAGTVFGSHLGLGMHLYDHSTLLRLRLERGYKVPTIYQLYSAYGSLDLKNETSLSWNMGIEQSIGMVELKLGVYKHLLTNLVDFDAATLSYQNIGSIETHGYELAVETIMLDDLTVKVGYGRTEHRNNQTGQPLLRRPRHKATLDVSSFIGSHARLTSSLLYVGERRDMDFRINAATVLKPYTTVGMTVNYSLSSDIDLYARGENLTDTHYEEVLGYGTPGRSGYIGTTVSL